MKIKKIIKNNISFIIAFIVGVLVSGGVVYAATAATDVSYNAPTGSGLSSNVKDALDGLYTKAASATGITTNNKGSVLQNYFLYGVTGDNTTNPQTAAGVCGNFNGYVICLKKEDYTNQQTRLRAFCTKVSGTRSYGGSYFGCTLGSVDCFAYSNGNVRCGLTSSSYCLVSFTGSASCS